MTEYSKDFKLRQISESIGCVESAYDCLAAAAKKKLPVDTGRIIRGYMSTMKPLLILMYDRREWLEALEESQEEKLEV